MYTTIFSIENLEKYIIMIIGTLYGALIISPNVYGYDAYKLYADLQDMLMAIKKIVQLLFDTIQYL